MVHILKLNSKGQAVKDLQSSLNKAGALPRLSEDGDFGKITDKAVREFQEEAGLVVDGKVGPQTAKALREFIAPVKPGRPEPNKDAMKEPTPTKEPSSVNSAPPPNFSSLKLLDTARFIDTIYVHCAATPEGKNFTVADIRAWHKVRGFSDVGYHYVTYLDGSIHLGRPIGQVGAHVLDHNKGSIGIVYIGGVSANGKTPKDTRTPRQRSSLMWLTQTLAKKHNIKRIRGHNEVAAKACPSFNVQTDQLGQII